MTSFRRVVEPGRAEESRDRGILEAALDAIIVIDARGHIMETNLAAERTLGRIWSAALLWTPSSRRATRRPIAFASQSISAPVRRPSWGGGWSCTLAVPTARSFPASLDELRDRAALRPGQCRHRPRRRCAGPAARFTAGHRHPGGTRGRQDAGHPSRRLVGHRWWRRC